MDPVTTLVFIVIVSNAGGEGKTLLARLLKALWELLGREVQLLDGDPGNFAAKIAELSAKVVGWGVGALKAPDIVAATRGKNVILDLGANSLASAREIVDLLPALRREYAAAGYRTVALMPVSTNKTGAVKAIKDLEAKIEDFETCFVKVNRDGSNTFDEGLDGLEVVHLEHLAPGLQNYVNGPGQSLFKSVTEPPPKFRMAAALVVDWMRKFAVQPSIMDIVGNALPILDLHAPNRPPIFRFKISRLVEATDEAIERNVYRSRILDALDEAGWSPGGLNAVAGKLRAGLI